MCKLFPHMVLSLCPFSYLLPLSGKFLSLFWLSPPHTHKTQATPKSNERFCFSRAPTPMPNPRSCFPRQAWDIWSVLECSWGVVFPGMWFLALETDRPISHAMLPEEEGWESCLDEGRGRDKCRHRICGCGREKRWADNPGSLGDPCLQNILVPWALQGVHPKSKPWVFPNAFHNRTSGWPVSMTLIKMYFVWSLFPQWLYYRFISRLFCRQTWQESIIQQCSLSRDSGLIAMNLFLKAD